MAYFTRLLPLITALLLCLPATAPAANKATGKAQTVAPATEKHAPAAPEIRRPGERQVFQCSTGIPFRVETSSSQDDLIWEVQYQAMLAPKFSPCQLCPVEERSPNMVIHRFTPKQAGMYKLRVRDKQADAAWSDWRTIRINSAPITPAATAKPASKKTKKKKASGQHTVVKK